jgi:hypothetical protein
MSLPASVLPALVAALTLEPIDAEFRERMVRARFSCALWLRARQLDPTVPKRPAWPNLPVPSVHSRGELPGNSRG